MTLFSTMHPRWQELLSQCEPALSRIEKSLVLQDFLPNYANVMRAFVQSPQEIRVVIFGQDPYPNPAHATGLAFSIPRDVRPVPASLRNIYKELDSDLGIVPAHHGDLSSWVDQGVALINRTLTFNSKTPSRALWREFTDEVARILGEKGCIAVLWGSDAQELAQYFPAKNSISSPHPSPLSAYRGFFGSKPFSRINNILLMNDEIPIDWEVK